MGEKQPSKKSAGRDLLLMDRYMYMEFVSGGELFSHLRRAGRFTNDTGKFFAASIILAMQHLHGKPPPPAPREKEPRAPPRARC